MIPTRSGRCIWARFSTTWGAGSPGDPAGALAAAAAPGGPPAGDPAPRVRVSGRLGDHLQRPVPIGSPCRYPARHAAGRRRRCILGAILPNGTAGAVAPGRTYPGDGGVA